jgi:membrane-bound metal-dependent hydrolase YbcI (DUF457 family)
MVLAFIHFITPVFLLKLFDRIKKISPQLLFFAAIGGIAPDLDYFYIWAVNLINGATILYAHRTIFHNIFFVAMLLVLILVLYSQDNCYTKYVMAFAFGVSIHIVLDMIDTTLPLFYPIFETRVGLELFNVKNRLVKLVMLDTVIFTIWVVYVSISGKLKQIL